MNTPTRSLLLLAITSSLADAQGVFARNSHAMATGPGGGVVLLGGSSSNAPRLADTLWSWTGTEWRALSHDGPVGRTLPAAAYDSRRNVLVVYGGAGIGSGTRFGDTWEWNGQAWQQKNVRTPGPRDHHVMAFDSARGQMVMYGGLVSTSLVGGTWTWNGTTWSLADSSGGPGPLGHSAMAYDSRRQRIVMFGGLPPQGPRLADTWEWDGTRWTRITTPLSPGPRSHHRMAYDAVRGVIVLFGGGDSTSTDTWTYDGSNWTRQSVEGPPPRWSAAMAWDSNRQRIVMFGGGRSRRPFGSLNDVWEWDGSRWTEVVPRIEMPPLHGEMTIFEPQRRTVVALGGGTPGGPLVGTWEWNGDTWRRTADSAASPSLRSGHAMAFDPVGNRTFVFGGMWGPPLQLRCDTWVRTGSEWRLANNAPCATDRVRNASVVHEARTRSMLLIEGPAAGRDTATVMRIWRWRDSAWVLVDSTGPRRTGFSEVAYDEARSVLVVPVLFGGPDAGVWEWNGSRWTHNAAIGPSVRQTYGLAYAPHLRRVVLAGGQGGFRGPYHDDLWTWDGSRWTELQRGSGPIPPGRGGGRLMSDASNNRLLYFGGYNETPLADLWELTRDGWRQLAPRR